MPDAQEKPATLEYHAPEPTIVPTNAFVALSLCIPSIYLALLFSPVRVIPLQLVVPLGWLWAARAFVMVVNMISMRIYCDARVKVWTWWMKINLAVSIPSLAICTFFILRGVARMLILNGR